MTINPRIMASIERKARKIMKDAIPEDVKHRLYLAALKRDGMGIKPCGRKFSDGFKVHGDRLFLYYNLPADAEVPFTTHTVCAPLNEILPPVERPTMLLLR